MKRILSGITALAGLGAALIGLPWLLVNVGAALADLMPTWSQVPAALLAPGDGGLFLGMVLAVGWLCWLTFMVAFIAEVVARARGVSAPNLGRFFPQVTAARAVTAVVVMFTTLTPQLSSAAPATAAPVAVVATTTAPDTALVTASVTDGGPATDHTHARAHPRRYTVEPGDTLWEISDDELGDPQRYREIFKASRNIAQDDGQHLSDPDTIQPGWELNIPIAKSTPKRQHSSPTTKPKTVGKDEDREPASTRTPEPVVRADETQPRVPAGPMAPTGPVNAAIDTPLHLPDSTHSASPDVTPLHPTQAHGVEGLPHWITTPLIPSVRE